MSDPFYKAGNPRFNHVAMSLPADLLDEPGIDARGVEAAHLVKQRTIDELLGRVQPHAPQLRAERRRHLERGVD